MWAMTEAHERAVALAQFYVRQLAERAGMRWEGDNDNDTEVELMVGYVIDASAARLRGQLDDAVERIRVLEQQTPQARQLQLEADQAAADLAESGYDRHGRDCRCPYCATDEDWPEERGISEYNREEFALDRGEERSHDRP
jgi:hypothetical protein